VGLGRAAAARVRGDWERSGLITTALGAVGFSLGIVVARVEADHTARSAAFARTAGFSVWCAITGFEVALWVICWTRARSISRETKQRLPPTSVWPFIVVVVTLIAAARVALLLYPTVRTPVYGMPVRQVILQGVGMVAAAPALFGIWRVQAWLRGLAADDLTRTPGKVIADLLFARETLKRLLLILSLMIGSVVFATGSLRSALMAAGASSSSFPATSVILFGALFTAMLGLLFAPAYADLRELQAKIRDTLSVIPEDGLPTEDWHGERERLTALLHLDSSSLEALRSAALLLTPFLSALITLFVRDLKI
jgi:hypothetical protein